MALPPACGHIQVIRQELSRHLSKWTCSLKSLWWTLIATFSTTSQHLILSFATSFLKLSFLVILYTVLNSPVSFLIGSLPPPNPKSINSHHSEPQALDFCPWCSHWKSHSSPWLLPLPLRIHFKIQCLQFCQIPQRIPSVYSMGTSNATLLKFILILSPTILLLFLL